MAVKPFKYSADSKNDPLSRSTVARVEWIGQMDDRRKVYLGNRDRAGLGMLAAEYESHGMFATAAKVRREAEGITDADIPE